MSTKSKQLRTPYRIERDRRDMAIYREYNRLIKKPDTMKSLVEEHLMVKYGYHSRSTIWAARKRAAKRLKEAGK